MSQQLTQPTLTNTGADEYLPYRRESEDHETVSGLLSVVYGSTPEVGDMAVLDPYEFRVLERSRQGKGRDPHRPELRDLSKLTVTLRA